MDIMCVIAKLLFFDINNYSIIVQYNLYKNVQIVGFGYIRDTRYGKYDTNFNNMKPFPVRTDLKIGYKQLAFAGNQNTKWIGIFPKLSISISVGVSPVDLRLIVTERAKLGAIT